MMTFVSIPHRSIPSDAAGTRASSNVTSSSFIDEPLQEIERRFGLLEPAHSPLHPVLQHVASVPGKRLRARMVLASSQVDAAAPNIDDAVIDAALSIELLHEASLIHDDICDGSQLRRNAPSVVARFGMRTATLAGGLLMSHGLMRLGRISEQTGIRIPFGMLQVLSAGQILELLPPPLQKPQQLQKQKRPIHRQNNCPLHQVLLMRRNQNSFFSFFATS